MHTSEIYIIKITPYRESSNIYDAIAKDYGKITLIHKGIKTNKKKNSLELFSPYKINWSGKSDIKFIRDYESIDRLDLSPTHNVIGMYYNEIMHYLTRNEYQIEKLYDHYSNSKFILYDKITYAANKKYIRKLLKKKKCKVYSR